MKTMPAVRTIRLYGKLGARFGRQFRLAVSSPAEAVHALCKMLPGFEREMMQSKDHGVGYAVLAGERHLAREELRQPAGSDDIRIAPVIMGCKRGGLFNIIFGAVLVLVGSAVALLSWGSLAPLGASIANMGFAMIVGGVVQLLTPVPKGIGARDKEENRPSYSFNGPVNTQAQGNCVPLLYGELIVGSAVISAGIIAKDQAYVPTENAGNNGANGSDGGGASPVWYTTFSTQQEIE